jgi:hypothetical protein
MQNSPLPPSLLLLCLCSSGLDSSACSAFAPPALILPPVLARTPTGLGAASGEQDPGRGAVASDE